MAHTKEQGHSDCGDSSPWAVVDADGKKVSCHASEEDADAKISELDAATEETVSGESDDGETLAKGEPSKGTPKDKRLKENKKAKKSEGDTEDLRARMDQLAADLATLSNMTPEEAAAAVATFASKPVTASGPTAGWSGVICVEGITSGDYREFSKGALTWADPPIPLRWKKEDSHGGVNDVTVAVGTITAISRTGGKINGQGTFDLGSEDGREAHRRVKEGFLAGISIDADDISDADVELVWPEAGPDDESDDEDDFLMMLFASPEKIVYHAGRIRAATLVDIPAFVEAKIGLDDSVTASGEITAEELDEQVRTEMGDTVTAGATPTLDERRPPRAWFENPKLSVPMNVIVTDEGRVYGHAAYWSECHIGHPDMCVTAPYEDSHPYFMTGELVTDDGTRVSVGQITLDTGHAPLAYDARRAAEHYDDTGAAVADVAIGNDEHGIWIAGAVRAGINATRVRDLRAAGKVSGDWRRIGGQLRMVGLLAVNVGGFQSTKVRSRVAGGQQLALIAAGQPHVGGSTVDLEQRALRMVMDRLAKRISTEE